jgi:hypothetical protein
VVGSAARAAVVNMELATTSRVARLADISMVFSLEQV